MSINKEAQPKTVQSKFRPDLNIQVAEDGTITLSKNGRIGSPLEFISDPMDRINVMEEIHDMANGASPESALHFQKLRTMNQDGESRSPILMAM